MRLLYDARLATRGLGISTFVVQLAHALIASGEVELIWLGDPAVAPLGARSVVRIDRRPYPLLDGSAGRAFARRTGADLIHFTANTGWQRPGAIPSVLTLHDLIFLDSGVRARSLQQVVGHRYERRLVARAAATADSLVVPSHTVAAQVRHAAAAGSRCLRSSTRVSPDRSTTSRRLLMRDTLASMWRQSGLPTSSALPGATRASKPWSSWRRGASWLRRQCVCSCSLLEVCHRVCASRWCTSSEAGLVEIHPHLPRDRLWSLLKGALALIYPSSDEGFGLPVLEGMAAGIPVLSGIAPVTREIGGDAIVQLDPSDIVRSTVAAVRRLLSDPREADAARDRGRQRARQFTWQATAAGYMAAYRDAMARHR